MLHFWHWQPGRPLNPAKWEDPGRTCWRQETMDSSDWASVFSSVLRCQGYRTEKGTLSELGFVRQVCLRDWSGIWAGWETQFWCQRLGTVGSTYTEKWSRMFWSNRECSYSYPHHCGPTSWRKDDAVYEGLGEEALATIVAFQLVGKKRVSDESPHKDRWRVLAGGAVYG